jgi:hypothetical protein
MSVANIDLSSTTYATRYAHYVTEIGPFVLTSSGLSVGVEIDSMLQFRLSRDPTNASDTWANTLFILNADLHVKTNRFNTFNRLPPFYS